MSDNSVRTSGWRHVRSAIAILLLMLPASSRAQPATHAANPQSDRDASLSPMRSIIEHDTADREALERKYGGAASESGGHRVGEFYEQELAKLKALHFDELD